MNKILLVERFSSKSRFWENLLRRNKISNLSAEDVVNKYYGFEGNMNIFISVEGDFCIDKSKIITENNVDLIYCYLISFDSNLTDKLNKTEIRFMGYDFGICEEDFTVYSSIVNEILFGVVEELVRFQFQLNDNFLFSDKNALNHYADLHHRLFLEGRDIEHDENMKAYEIWKIM